MQANRHLCYVPKKRNVKEGYTLRKENRGVIM